MARALKIILKSKRSKRASNRNEHRKKQFIQRHRQLYWPQDFVNKPHDLLDIIEAKIASQTCDEDER